MDLRAPHVRWYTPSSDPRMLRFFTVTTEYHGAERKITHALGDLRPVAVAYLEAPPGGVEKFEGTVPSGCSFWSLAGKGRSFYTVPSDHFNCPIGSYTHAIDLPPERSAELEQTLGLMASVGYVQMEEIPSIPRLPRAPAYTYYGPLATTSVNPDVVIFTGRPGRLMRLQEAAARANVASQLPLLGRPTCMALPAAMMHGSVMSMGCIGNRVYTDLGEDEFYLMIPGPRLMEVAEHASVIASANDALEQYHTQRRGRLERK
jgi:uncharacterized protein (DUF169 family)